MHQDETRNIQHATLHQHHTTYSGRPTREAHQDKVKMLLFDAGRARLRRCANASDCTAMHCVAPPTAEEPLRSKRTPDELWLYARGTLYVVCQVCIKDTRIPKNSRCVFAAKAPENWPARSSRIKSAHRNPSASVRSGASSAAAARLGPRCDRTASDRPDPHRTALTPSRCGTTQRRARRPLHAKAACVTAGSTARTDRPSEVAQHWPPLE